ncbi:hypothetical protein [Actinomadura sp. 9N407]|uniref:hypothetical protein n=1 Tax=Actinomadura sp. 9N407 TaxID=3375154 RepID=UPI00379E2449
MKIAQISPLRRAAPAAVAVLTAATLTVAAPAARADSAWTVGSSPFTLGTSALYGVSAAAPDAVTIGGYQWASSRRGIFCGVIGGPCSPTVHQNPVLQERNGGGWSMTSTPGLPGKGQIQFVDAVSATDVWAAGSRDTANGKGSGTPYVARSGAQGWQEVAVPPGLRVLESFDGDAAGAWLGGEAALHGGTSVYRWADGTWTPHALDAVIQGVRQRAADDVWAVGRVPKGGGAPERGYAARFDGTTWHTMTPPQVQGKGGRLVAVLPLAADDVWITGYVFENGVRKDASYHWNGSEWREDVLPGGARFGGGIHHISSANANYYLYYPDGLVDDGAGGLWAVPSLPVTRGEPQILRYTSGSWRLEQTATGVQGEIRGIARVPGTSTLWAVGQRDGKDPLVLTNG